MSGRDDKRADAGVSARREHDRRRRNREQRTRERRPRIGKLLLALTDAPASERSWAVGARAEMTVADVLARRCRPEVVVLHDRRRPRGRANIDHIALAASGVWVIDTKAHRGKVDVGSRLLGMPRLRIAGRDQTPLVEALANQVEAVRAELDLAIPVHGALCFVNAELPLLGTLSIRGFQLLYPRPLARRLNARGPVAAELQVEAARRVAERFPRA